MISKYAAIVALAVMAATTSALADVTISTDPTQNVTCSGGICVPTATDAVLNVADLEVLLESEATEVTTTGNKVQASDIVVSADLTWTSSYALTFDAWHAVTINKPISVDGLAGLTLTTDGGGAGGSLNLGPRGRVIFANLSSNLSINGAPYTLVGDVKTLSSEISSNPYGRFALAADYDASSDGTYSSSPIADLDGIVEGLGNRIKNLTISDTTDADIGLFAQIESGAVVRDIGLAGVGAYGNNTTHDENIGALVGQSLGQIIRSYAQGIVSASGNDSYYISIGGLVGTMQGGFIDGSFAECAVTGASGASIGGLVGTNEPGTSIKRSYSSGSVMGGQSGGAIGGLVGSHYGQISRSYSTGSVSGTAHAGVGGLVGYDGWVDNPAVITQSFATGNVSSGNDSSVGGLVGLSTDDTIKDSYAYGAVTGGANTVKDSYLGTGGLVGSTGYSALISDSYSTGPVTAGAKMSIGGAIGSENGSALKHIYWDTTTSGITSLSQGCGNIANCPGITGLSTEQFQSRLPKGFHPKIWAENPNINNGLPYLINNPPPQ